RKVRESVKTGIEKRDALVRAVDHFAATGGRKIAACLSGGLDACGHGDVATLVQDEVVVFVEQERPHIGSPVLDTGPSGAVGLPEWWCVSPIFLPLCFRPSAPKESS